MLRQPLIIIAIPLFFASCGNGEKTNNPLNSQTSQGTVSKTDKKVRNALKFINAYVDTSDKINKTKDMVDWVDANSLTTKAFKLELKKIIDDAYKQDPEMGLDADPIFDAQDYPDKGFELESFDENTNYLTVTGKDWPEFKVTMKVIDENRNWLVDGCGIVNIPNDRRAKR